jgi:hypothetical protein
VFDIHLIDERPQGFGTANSLWFLVSATLFIPAQPAINAVEAGIYACEQLMYSWKLKAFTSFGSWYSEFRLCRRDQQKKAIT